MTMNGEDVHEMTMNGEDMYEVRMNGEDVHEMTMNGEDVHEMTMNGEDVGEWQGMAGDHGCIKISGCNDLLDIIMGSYEGLVFNCFPTPTGSLGWSRIIVPKKISEIANALSKL